MVDDRCDDKALQMRVKLAGEDIFPLCSGGAQQNGHSDEAMSASGPLADLARR
jgi:hypothetical protein